MMRRFLIRLYPADWRERYAAEFDALLEERPLGPFDVADVLLSAIDAHIRPRGSAAAGDHTRGVLMSLRIGGVAAMVGGALWIVSLAGASGISGTSSGDGQPWLTLFLLALVALVVALIGLSGEQGRRQPGLVWTAVGIPIVGAVTSAVGMIGMLTVGDRPFILGVTPWNVWALGSMALIIGSGLFALASLPVRGLSRAATILLVVGAIATLPLLFGIAYTNELGDAGSIVLVVAILSFAVGWVWLGISAIRADRAGAIGYREAIP
jgi:hypothetical protein